MVVIKKRTVKRVVYLVVVLALLYFAYALFWGVSYPNILTPKPVFGNLDSHIKVIEFSDLQCPACKAAHPLVKEIKEEFAQNISFQYYHFPLRELHPYAQKAAEAVECANDQGKFWEFIDVGFGRSPRLTNDDLKQIALQIGLNVKNFTACLDSGAKQAIVEGDYRFGSVKQVQGTPTFFVNDKRVENWQDLKAEIEQEIK